MVGVVLLTLLGLQSHCGEKTLGTRLVCPPERDSSTKRVEDTEELLPSVCWKAIINTVYTMLFVEYLEHGKAHLDFCFCPILGDR